MDDYHRLCQRLDLDSSIRDLNFIIEYAKTPVMITVGKHMEKTYTITGDVPFIINTTWTNKIDKSKHFKLLFKFIVWVNIPDDMITSDIFNFFVGFPAHSIKKTIEYIGKKSPKYIECWYNAFKETIDENIRNCRIKRITKIDSLKYLMQLFANEFTRDNFYKYIVHEDDTLEYSKYIYEHFPQLIDHNNCLESIIECDRCDLYDFWKDKLVTTLYLQKDNFLCNSILDIENREIFNDIVYNCPDLHFLIKWISAIRNLKFDKDCLYMLYITGVLHKMDWLDLAYCAYKVLKKILPYESSIVYDDIYPHSYTYSDEENTVDIINRVNHMKSLVKVILDDIDDNNVDREVVYNILISVIKMKSYSTAFSMCQFPIIQIFRRVMVNK